MFKKARCSIRAFYLYLKSLMVIQKEFTDRLQEYKEELYFYLLKKARDEEVAKEVFQNTCLRAIEKYAQLKHIGRLRAWLFQIARNEFYSYHRQELQFKNNRPERIITESEMPFSLEQEFCCFDKFIEELPDIYREVIVRVYKKGETQKEAAESLALSLANCKARIRRAKHILKEKFQHCCQYQLNEHQKLGGDPDCERCHSIS